MRKKLGDNWVNATEWFYMGIVLYEQKDINNAIDCFDKAISIYKNFSDAKYYKARCLLLQSKNKDALGLALKALADFQQGYSIIEDGTPYETYPYQVNEKYYLKGLVKYLQEELKS